MNDLIHLACLNACRSFGGNDGVFTSATFGLEMSRLANLATPMDGRMVEVVLCGRQGIKVLRPAYWQMDNVQVMAAPPSTPQDNAQR
jgi:hypothetical protein